MNAPRNTFTKFDQLGAVLAELSFRAVSLHVTHCDDGTTHSTVYLHGEVPCAMGVGDTPSDALQHALTVMAHKEAARIEAAADQVAA